MGEMEKFKRLVHYICAQAPHPSRLGATKLNKVLWYAEREAFVRLGKPITGVRYIKRQFGPVPAPIVSVLKMLSDEKTLLIRETEWDQGSKREFFSLTEPDISDFDAQEISIVNRVLLSVCSQTAKSISEKSHDEVWRLAEIGEELPFFTVFAVPGELDEEDMAWANMEIDRLEAQRI